jgi:hypothetical protein
MAMEPELYSLRPRKRVVLEFEPCPRESVILGERPTYTAPTSLRDPIHPSACSHQPHLIHTCVLRQGDELVFVSNTPVRRGHNLTSVQPFHLASIQHLTSMYCLPPSWAFTGPEAEADPQPPSKQKRTSSEVLQPSASGVGPRLG